jgi:hypothetical protein
MFSTAPPSARQSSGFIARCHPPPFIVLWAHERSFFAPHAAGPGGALFLARQSDPINRLMDAGHEVFHWYITPSRCHQHWTQEMLAVHFSLLCLYRSNDPQLIVYANQEAEWFRAQACRCELDHMLTNRLSKGDDTFCGRAFVTGEELIDALDWAQTKRLACSFDEDEQVSVRRWFGQLSWLEQARARAVLGTPTPRWV